MEGGSGDRGTGHGDGGQDGHRGDSPGSAHLDGDIQKSRVDFLGRILVGDGPAGCTGGGTQPALEVPVLKLDHDAVQGVLDVVAVLSVVVDHVKNLIEGGNDPVVGGDRNPPLLVEPIGLGLVDDLIV